jgi:hypothetical protein
MTVKDNCDMNFEDFLKLFEPKIYKSLSQTIYQEREDLAQEICLKMIEKYQRQKFNDNTPKFWEMINL